MKYLILSSIVLFLSVNCLAKKHKIKKVKNPKLSYDEYVMQYGNNDTSLAIIDLFFGKRNEAAIGKMSFLPITAGVTVVMPPIGLGLSALSSPLFVSGLVTRHRYSHKNLMIALNSYRNRNMLSENFRHKIFEQMKTQKAIHDEEERANQLMALKGIYSD